MDIIFDQIDLITLKFSAVKRGQSSPRKWLFITATFNAILVCFFSGGGAEVRFGVEYHRFLMRFLGIRCDKSKADGRHKVCLEVRGNDCVFLLTSHTPSTKIADKAVRKKIAAKIAGSLHRRFDSHLKLLLKSHRKAPVRLRGRDCAAVPFAFIATNARNRIRKRW